MGACLNRQKFVSLARNAALACACLALANCAQNSGKFARSVDPKYGVSASERAVEYGEPVPKGGGRYSVGKPYTIAGKVYTPSENRSYTAEGLASWYGDDFHGRRTANGELFDMDGLTAAHPTLPMPSYVRVTNVSNRKSVIVRVNDRGPYHSNRLIDVSRKAAYLLGFHGNGIARVRVDYVGQASLGGSDDRLLEATLREGEPAPAPSAVRLASAGSFVPQGNRMAAIQGSIPIPADRPYSLGEEAAAAEPQPVGAPQTRPAHASTAQISPAIARQPAPVRSATLLPRSLTDQAHAMSGSESSSGFRQAQAMPAETSAFAPMSGGRSSVGRGLY